MTWDGAFAPIRKHRDYLHATFYEHLIANGVAPDLCTEPLWCDINPITDEALSRRQRYFLLFLTISLKPYVYLIPENPEQPEGEPTDDDIKKAMTRYLKNNILRGRDINNYIDFESGINRQCIDDMVSHGLGDKVDFRWTDNQTESSAKRP